MHIKLENTNAKFQKISLKKAGTSLKEWSNFPPRLLVANQHYFALLKISTYNPTVQNTTRYAEFISASPGKTFSMHYKRP